MAMAPTVLHASTSSSASSLAPQSVLRNTRLRLPDASALSGRWPRHAALRWRHRSLGSTTLRASEGAFREAQALQGNADDMVPCSPFARNLVVAVDGTEDSIRAFRWTLSNIYRKGDKIHVLHIMPDGDAGPASGSIYYCPPDDPEVERSLWSQAKEFIEDNFVAVGRAAGVHIEVVLVKEKHKGIGWALCKKAEELEAQPLILAAHTKSKLEELLMGSTSKFCVSHCKQPVLLLH